MKLDSTLSSVVFPAPVPPETMTFSRAATTAWSIEHRRVIERSRPGRPAPACRSETADREQRAVERQRRNDRVDARAVGQPGVHHRARLVDPAAHCGLTIRSMIRIRWPSSLNGRWSARACRCARRRPACALLTRMSEIVGVGQQRLERPEAEHLVEHLVGDLLLLARGQEVRLFRYHGQDRFAHFARGCGRRRCSPARRG